ncbi:MAG: FlgD immunoglobulin-like domain containing protein [candidate division FCPU426 bacterium]
MLGALALGLAGTARAYVTSAVLEYSGDDEVGFYLNGKVLLHKSEFVWADFTTLSTSDGSLPIYLFNMNGDNVLAVENFDTEGGHMGVAYRLTVHHSNGDPVVIWSEPGVTRFKHLRPDQKDPEGWFLPGYDDAAWPTAIEGNLTKDNQFVRWPCLPDSAFGFLGSTGCVPYISHIASARSNGHDHNLLRSHFKFPNTPAQVSVVVNPPKATKGQNISLRLIPGKDATYFERFQVFARVPPGLKVISLSKGGYMDPKSSAIFWDFSLADSGVGYLTLSASTLLQAPGWTQPQKALGPPKAGKVRRQLNTPAAIFADGAKFNPGNPGWFGMQPPLGVPAGAEILGVIFHSQMRLSGRDSYHTSETDPIYLNYSVDGSLNDFLKKDVMVSRTSGDFYWVDGYYDASEDRRWTWGDLEALRVKVMSRQRRAKNSDLLASVSVVIRYFLPQKMAPYFTASVEDGRCVSVPLAAGIRQPGQPAVGSKPAILVLNAGLCPPTPMPTATPVPVQVAQVVAPTPEPTRPPLAKAEEPALLTRPAAALKLGCLENAPEPFKRGGTFVYFCVDKDSDLRFNVFDSAGKLVRGMEAGSFRPGKGQLFFNGLDDKGLALPAGNYSYEIRARSENGVDSRNARFSKVRDR